MSKTISNNRPLTMEELLNSLPSKSINIQFGQEIEGKVINIGDREIVLDFGGKSEGILPVKDLSQDKQKTLKVGDTLKAFVAQAESESGQVILSGEKQVAQRSTGRGGFKERNRIDWNKFITAKSRKTQLQGTVLEINKGGLILDVDGVRGFLPGSQIGASVLNKLAGKEEIIGTQFMVEVIEIDQDNNRLIFSQKGLSLEEDKNKLKGFKSGETIKGAEVVAVYPFGAIVDANNQHFLINPQDISWERVDDPASVLKIGEKVDGKILTVDTDYGRVTLSLKAALEDPFTKIAEKFQIDDVISGVVSVVGPTGVAFTLTDGVEGFLPSSKMTVGAKYEVGQKMQLLVDNVDTNRRKINLAPFITSTEGLIYK